MTKFIPNNTENIMICFETVMRAIDSFFIYSNNHNKVANFSFIPVTSENFFLFMEADNGNIESKNNLNIDETELTELYKLLYKEFKERYLESLNEKISLEEAVNLVEPENSFLRFYIRDIHRNLVRFEFRNFGQEREILDEIKTDWVELVNKKRSSKRK